MRRFLVNRSGRVSLILVCVACVVLVMAVVVSKLAMASCPGHTCCGAVCYDSATEGCCNGVVYDRATQGCCIYTNTVYDLATQMCCEDCSCVEDL